MRQQINLFQESLRPRQLRWSAKQLTSLMAIAVLLLVVFELVGVWQTWQVKQSIAESEQIVSAKQKEVKQVEASYPKPQEDQRLVNRLEQLKDEIQQKQLILGLLEKKEYGNSRGFADHLSGLSRQHVEGIWLTHFSIEQGGKQLGLSGSSLKPELVPRFIRNLSNEPSFAGKEFKTLLLSRTEEKNTWVDFDLNTELRSEATP